MSLDPINIPTVAEIMTDRRRPSAPKEWQILRKIWEEKPNPTEADIARLRDRAIQLVKEDEEMHLFILALADRDILLLEAQAKQGIFPSDYERNIRDREGREGNLNPF